MQSLPSPVVSEVNNVAEAQCRDWKRPLARLLILLQVVQAPFYAGQAIAQVRPDTNAQAGQRPLIDAAQNGVPIVHIAPPTAAGVSRNQYEQFNVGNNGLILNNSNTHTQTQLGGWITANPQLGATPARIILNEVTSTNASQLSGYIEVAGQRADIVIANPNGISCDGCGFLNADRATLSTGRPEFSADGNLQALNVQQGEVRIGSSGLNATNLERLDLIARGIVIEGELWAQDLRAMAGANRVLYGSLQAVSQQGTGTPPQFAIDIKGLGGMYARQIHLVANEKGLGVNSSGRLMALQGNLVLSAEGDLTLGGETYAAQGGKLSGANVSLSGALQSEASLELAAGGLLKQTGVVDAKGALTLDAADIANSGTLIQRGAGGASLRADGTVLNTGTVHAESTLDIAAAAIQSAAQAGNPARLLSAGDMKLAAAQISLAQTQLVSNGAAELQASAGDLQLAQSQLHAAGPLTLAASAALRNDGSTVQSAQSVTLAADQIVNRGQVQAGTVLSAAAQALDNRQGALQSQAHIDIVSDQIDNRDGGLIAAGQSLQLAAKHLDNRSGVLSAQQNLTAHADSIDNAQGVMVADADLTLNVAQINNQRGALWGLGTLAGNGTALDNRQGVAVAGDSMLLNFSGVINNADGDLRARTGSLTASADTISNIGGRIWSQGALRLSAGSVVNLLTEYGLDGLSLPGTGEMVYWQDLVYAGHDPLAWLRAAFVPQGGAEIVSADSLVRIQADTLENSGGVVRAGTDLELAGGNVSNTLGELSAERDVSLTASSLQQTAMARTVSGRDVSVVADNVDNRQGAQIEAGRDLRIQAGVLTNTESFLTDSSAGSGSRLTAIRSGADMQLSAQAIVNTAQIRAEEGLQIKAESLSNALDCDCTSVANIHSGKAADIEVGTLQNFAADITSDGAIDLRLLQGQLEGSYGRIYGKQGLTITAPEYVIDNGVLASDGVLSLMLGNGSFINNSGQASAGQLQVHAGRISNTGVLYSNGALTLATPGEYLENSFGRIVARGMLSLSGHGIGGGELMSTEGGISIDTDGLDFSHRGIQAAGTVDIQSGFFDNDYKLVSGEKVILNTTGLSNLNGKILASENIAIQTQELNNRYGLIRSDGDVHIDTQGQQLHNLCGTPQQPAGANCNPTNAGIVALGNIALNTGELNNNGGLLAAGKAVTVTSQGDVHNRQGLLYGESGLSLSGNNIDNARGRVESLGNAQLTATQGVTNTAGTIKAEAQLTLNAPLLTNNREGGAGPAGNIEAGALTINTAEIDNAAGRIVALAQADIQTAKLDNTQNALIGAKGSLTLQAEQFNNVGGQVRADQALSITTSSANIGGTLESRGSLNLAVQGHYQNSGTVQADTNLSLTADSINNSGILRAGQTLTATATGDIHNSGEISATTTRISAGGTLTNTGSGLIDGTLTDIKANTITNTGRIYGDLLQLQGDTINNSTTGVIAARAQLEGAAKTINNTSGALIYSLGDISLAGSHDADGKPIGTVNTLTNDGATIEARGNLHIAASSLHNLNSKLQTAQVIKGSTNTVLVQPLGWNTRFPAAQCSGIAGGQDKNTCIVNPETYGKAWPVTPVYTTVPGECDWDNNCEPDKEEVNYSWNAPAFATFEVTPVGPPPAEPAGGCYDSDDNGEFFTATPICVSWKTDLVAWKAAYKSALGQLETAINAYNAKVAADNAVVTFEDYTLFKVTATDSETQVVSTAPGKLLSGGAMEITGAVSNHDSQIIAGGSLIVDGPSIDNQETKGKYITSFGGTAQFTHVVSCGNAFNNKHCRKWEPTLPYNQPNNETVKDLGLTVELDNQNQTSLRAIDTVAAIGAAGPGSLQNLTQRTLTPIGPVLLAAPDAPQVQPRAYAPTTLQVINIPGGTESARQVVLSSPPSLNLPGSSLFAIHSQPTHGYVVETDPRFTNGQTFLSSDYFLSRTGYGQGGERSQAEQQTQLTLRSIGDGFYEQRLIDDQIIALTGRRYLSGYTSTESQYLALMDAGVAFAQQYQIAPGVTLSAEQMALVTADMVWLSPYVISYADGRRETVLVPQVYLRRPAHGDLQYADGTGATSASTTANPTLSLISGQDVWLQSSGNISNSGSILARQSLTVLAGGNLTNQLGTISGNDVYLRAEQDLRNLSGTIQGTGSNSQLSLLAGRDLVIESQLNHSANDWGSRSNVARTALVQGDSLTLNATRDLNILGAQVLSTGALQAQAGRNLNIESVAQQYQLHVEGQDKASNAPSGAYASAMRVQQFNIDPALAASGQARLDGNSSEAASTNPFGSTRRDGISESSTTQHLAVLQSGGTLLLSAGEQLSLTGADIDSRGNALLSAQNIQIAAARNSQSQHTQTATGQGFNRVSLADEQAVGGRINAAGDLTLIARPNADTNSGTDANALIQAQPTASGGNGGGNTGGSSTPAGASTGNISLTGASVNSDSGQTTLSASGDIAINSLATAHSSSTQSQYSTRNLLSSRASAEASQSQQVRQTASEVSGASVLIDAGRNLDVTGSRIVADNAVQLQARGDIRITAAQESSSSQSRSQQSQSGLFSSNGGMGFTIGQRSKTETDTSAQTSALASQIGSLQGNVSITAAGQYQQSGSDVLSPQGDTSVTAQRITVDGVEQTQHSEHRVQERQSGLTLQVSSNVITAAQQVQQMLEAAESTSNARVRAMALAAAALIAANSVQSAAENPEITASLTLGSSQSSSSDTQHNTYVRESTLAAGRDLTLTAGSRESGVGSGTPGDITLGDITIRGSDLSAGRNATLSASGNVTLQSAQETSDSQRRSQSAGGGIGVAATYAAQTNTASVGIHGYANASGGNSDSSALSHRNSHLAAGQTVQIDSGATTALHGAVISGNQVQVTTQNLSIQSQQDLARFRSTDLSASGAITCWFGCSGNVAANATQMQSDYRGVTEQSGIQAGQGGYQINVAGHTQLTGGVIASTATPSNNQLKTGTLATSDLQNKAEYSGTSIGLSGGFSFGGTAPASEEKPTGDKPGQSNSTGNTAGGNNPAGASNPGGFNPQNRPFTMAGHQAGGQNNATLATPSLAATGDNAQSTTRSAISAGELVITNEAGQQALTGQSSAATIASVNRDTTNAAGLLTPIFKEEEIRTELQVIQAFAPLAAKAVGDFAATQIKAYEKAEEARALAQTTLADPKASQEERNAAQTLLGLADQALTREQANYDLWKEGGIARVAAHTLVGSLTGGADGATGAALSATAMPQLGTLIEQSELPSALKSGLNLAAATALGSLTGPSGASAAYNTEAFNRQLHPKEIDRIKELAKDWAGRGGITEEEALARLTRQALRQVDTTWASYLPGEDNAARVVLDSKAQGSIANPNPMQGNYTYFSATTKQEKDDATLFAGTLSTDRNLYAAAASIPPAYIALQNQQHNADAQTLLLAALSGPAATKVGQLLLATGRLTAAEIATVGREGIKHYCAARLALCGELFTAAVATAAGAEIPSLFPNLGSVTRQGAQLVDQMASRAGQTTIRSITDIAGPTNFQLPPMSQVPSTLNAGQRLGEFGEELLAKTVLDQLSPGYRPLQNGAGHGADGIGLVDDATRTIHSFEIKTTDTGNRQGVGDLVQRTENWINDAASGKLSVSASDQAFAIDLKDKIDNQGYSVKPYVVEVAVPSMGQGARPVVTVTPHPRPTPMPRPTTAPIIQTQTKP